MDLKRLHYFCTIADQGQISRAARVLHMAQPPLSQRLRELEEELGTPLFLRQGRELQLTDAGRRILSYAEQIFTIGDELLDVLYDQRAQSTTPFRVGIADSLSKSVAYRLVEPALRLPEPVRLICREGRLDALLLTHIHTDHCGSAGRTSYP